jgi:hypothetical protein
VTGLLMIADHFEAALATPVMIADAFTGSVVLSASRPGHVVNENEAPWATLQVRATIAIAAEFALGAIFSKSIARLDREQGYRRRQVRDTATRTTE